LEKHGGEEKVVSSESSACGGRIEVTLVSSANERPASVAKVGRRGRRIMQVKIETPKIEMGLPPLLEALKENNSKYIHNFTSLVYLWLTYMYAHVGMLVCT
jgi:hypothetical protein